ncbi:MAG: UDP-N-acetylmuramoylalanyl-D-glutamyl-2, 6-diaminopimelate--D-alanyl-D-alanine ligase, partial [Sphingomonadaceae bacterium]|nr:UDP-N-acetylmuramoylalanyl-D-glutamyl-2, 6-diaminopimelate--D-alanyl-D-alanine ligase [Sphingomonadaceae bacterium]
GARRVIPLDEGEALLIDESYNANPASMAATLKLLGQENAHSRIAVLGAMRELGEQADAYHAALAGPIRDAQVDFAVLVGEEMAPLAEVLGEVTAFVHVADAAEAEEALADRIAPGDAVLVKGSNAIGLAALVEALARGRAACSS